MEWRTVDRSPNTAFVGNELGANCSESLTSRAIEDKLAGILKVDRSHRDMTPKVCDTNVRSMVASKRKIPESLMLSLAQDKDQSVRHALANNGKVTKQVLETLSNDSWQVVREVALQKMQALTRPSN